MTVESVEDAIKALYVASKKPRADLVEAILDPIELIASEKKRTILFVTAKQHLDGDLKDLVVAARARSNRAWDALEFSLLQPKTLH